MTADAVVIGAGIVGAAIADALARETLRVVIVDECFPAAGSTAAGMGHIVVMDDSPAQLALTGLSRDLFDDIASELPASCELDRCGTLWIAEDDAQLELAHTKLHRYAAAGAAAEMIDAAELQRIEPQLRRGLAGALRVSGDSVVYPPALCAFLLQRAMHAAARLVRARVHRIEPRAVVTDGGRIDAEIVINAAGVHAPSLTPGLPIVPRRGHLVITDRYSGFCRHQLVELGYMQSAHTLSDASVAFNLQPRRTGQLLIGSSRELAGFDGSINRAIVARMLQRATTFMPRLGELFALRTWTGFRPATEDKLPFLGPWTPMPGLWIAAGHEGLGIATALGSARIITDLLLGREPPIHAVPFAPARVLTAIPA